MTLFDWLVLLSTLGGIVAYGAWKNRQNASITEYLKGGNNARWWTVGLSVMATQASAITFLSTPGQAFHDGMGFVQFYFGLPFAVIIICLFFIPRYHQLQVFTAYEFLEDRFDRRTRSFTALLFLIQRGLAAGITIYAPAIILSVVLGWPLKSLIIIIGLIVICYTVVGGTAAVNVTQKQQMLVIFSGMLIAFGYIVDGLPAQIDIFRAFEIAGQTGKLNVLDFSFDPNSRYTFWSGITGGLFLALSYFGTDQSQVQRYLSGKSLRESQMGLIMNGFLKVPMQFFILLVGVMVFVFYQFKPAPLHFNPKGVATVLTSEQKNAYQALEKAHQQTQEERKALLVTPLDEAALNRLQVLDTRERQQRNQAKRLIKTADPEQETNDKDYVFITFILNHLPHGLIGLLLAVILSAAMSSTASELNALAATTTVDLYRRSQPNKSEKHYVTAAKGFTLLWGILAICFASIGNLFENLIQLVNIIGSLFYGTILGIFLLAFFFEKIQGKVVFWSAVLSEITVLGIYTQDWVGYLWLNAIGALLTVLLAVLGIHFSRKHFKK